MVEARQQQSEALCRRRAAAGRLPGAVQSVLAGYLYTLSKSCILTAIELLCIIAAVEARYIEAGRLLVARGIVACVGACFDCLSPLYRMAQGFQNRFVPLQCAAS